MPRIRDALSDRGTSCSAEAEAEADPDVLPVLAPDGSSVPPAPAPGAATVPKAAAKGRGKAKAKANGKEKETEKEEADAGVLPPPFTPSINKTLNMLGNPDEVGIGFQAPPLPEGLTVAQMKTRLTGKNKIKWVPFSAVLICWCF